MNLPDDDNEDDLMPGSRCRAIPGIVNIDTAENQKRNIICLISSCLSPGVRLDTVENQKKNYLPELMPGSQSSTIPGIVNIDTAENQKRNIICLISSCLSPGVRLDTVENQKKNYLPELMPGSQSSTIPGIVNIDTAENQKRNIICLISWESTTF